MANKNVTATFGQFSKNTDNKHILFMQSINDSSVKYMLFKNELTVHNRKRVQLHLSPNLH